MVYFWPNSLLSGFRIKSEPLKIGFQLDQPAGSRRVQRDGRANQSLQCLLVNLLALVEVDATRITSYKTMSCNLVDFRIPLGLPYHQREY
jgi:hypothetical protein